MTEGDCLTVLLVVGLGLALVTGFGMVVAAAGLGGICGEGEGLFAARMGDGLATMAGELVVEEGKLGCMIGMLAVMPSRPACWAHALGSTEAWVVGRTVAVLLGAAGHYAKHACCMTGMCMSVLSMHSKTRACFASVAACAWYMQ